MSGRPNKKMFATMVKKHGSEEAAREWFRTIGSRGGQNGTTGGFAADNVRARISGAMGGRYSRKGYKLIKHTEASGTYRRLSDGAIVEIKY